MSAYVANLAAFLTRKSLDGSFATMDEAVRMQVKICAHPAITTELGLEWPGKISCEDRALILLPRL